MIKEKLASVRERIKEAAKRVGRDPESVKLIVVTKEASIAEMRQAIEAGVTHIGENRVKDALSKVRIFNSHILTPLDSKHLTGLTWHMVGHLQSNKAKDAVKIFSVIHSVDSIKLGYIIDKEAERQNKIQDFLIEINTSGEEQKFGIKPNELGNFLKEMHSLKHTNILGLMTMAPSVDDAETTRPYFKKLKDLADSYGLKELSMGMTQDFEVAVEEGATMVRIGSAIFK